MMMGDQIAMIKNMPEEQRHLPQSPVYLNLCHKLHVYEKSYEKERLFYEARHWKVIKKTLLSKWKHPYPF